MSLLIPVSTNTELSVPGESTRCELCDQAFSTKRALRSHLETSRHLVKAGEIAPTQCLCPVCETAFSRPAGPVRHLAKGQCLLDPNKPVGNAKRKSETLESSDRPWKQLRTQFISDEHINRDDQTLAYGREAQRSPYYHHRGRVHVH
jgi:uncharacterized C2H2 Zn-finger protein